MKPEISLIPEKEKIELDQRRVFSKKKRAEIFRNSGGRCDLCGCKVDGPWVAGHVIPHWAGGRTEVDNGRVECPPCSKGTQVGDAGGAAKDKRIRGVTGRRKEGRRRKPIQSRGFPTKEDRKRAKERLNGLKNNME